MCWHASPVLKKKKRKKEAEEKEKTVSNNVFLLKSGPETSESLRVVCVMRKGAHAQGALGDTATHNHFFTSNFCYKRFFSLIPL